MENIIGTAAISISNSIQLVSAQTEIIKIVGIILASLLGLIIISLGLWLTVVSIYWTRARKFK